MTPDLLELAERAAAGDQEALHVLLEQNVPALRAFVRANMGPGLRARESASDLVQSVCRDLLTHRQRFQHPSEEAFRAWLFTTARRKVQNRARDLERQKRAADREVSGLQETALAALGPVYARITNPGDRALRNEEVERLEAAIGALPDEQREVVTLAHLVGLSRAEIARQLGKTEEGVRAMLHRAMARLSLLMDAP
ncbi:MAG: sigma-70 family RNA polymerase sigma factor [Planctomycetes bacterium]|nr:sigma-70 family RNA polymerase sigma factor [Planctomycetota bacterium]